MQKLRLVSIRLKREEATEYKKILVGARKTINEDLNEHIHKQIARYVLVDSRPVIPVSQRSKEYAQISFQIDEEVYMKYKKVLLEQHTNTTADIKRHILKTIDEEERKKKHEY